MAKKCEGRGEMKNHLRGRNVLERVGGKRRRGKKGKRKNFFLNKLNATCKNYPPPHPLIQQKIQKSGRLEESLLLFSKNLRRKYKIASSKTKRIGKGVGVRKIEKKKEKKRKKKRKRGKKKKEKGKEREEKGGGE